MNRNEILKRILRIAIPLMISNVIMQLQMLIDRIFLGRMDNYYMTAIGNVSAPLWTMTEVIFSLSVGASILISQSVGAGDHEKSKVYAAALLKWHNIIGIVFFFVWLFGAKFIFMMMGISDRLMPLCLGYVRYYIPIFLIVALGSAITVVMQTSNYTRPLVYYGLIRSGLNICLDYLLIFGHFGFPKMGIEGAALATAISEYVGGVYILIVFILSKKLNTRPSFKEFVKISIKPYLQSVFLGAPSACESFAWNSGNLMLIRILNTIDEFAAGIFTMAFNVEIVAVVIVSALCSSTMTLCGEATGAKDKKMFTGVTVYTYIMSAFVATVTLILCLVIPEQLLSLFTTDSLVIASSVIYLFYMAINLYCKSGNMIVGSAIKGTGDTRWMLYTQIFGTFFVIGVAAFFVYGLKLGIAGVFLAVIIDEMVRAIVNTIWCGFVSKKTFSI